MGKATIRAKQKDYEKSIGGILCHRIAEMGYTQERFSELSGVPKSTLTKHMNNSVTYRIDTLMKYAEILDCSYDYLLGYSKSPEREYHDAITQTGLSIDAVKTLSSCAKNKSNALAELALEVVNTIVCHKTFVSDLMDYFELDKAKTDILNQYVNTTLANAPIDIDSYVMRKSEVEIPLLIYVMNDLAEMKRQFANLEINKQISSEVASLKNELKEK